MTDIKIKPVGWFNPFDDYHGYQQASKAFEGASGTIPLYSEETIDLFRAEISRLKRESKDAFETSMEMQQNWFKQEIKFLEKIENLCAEIARKDAALREYGGHRQACYYHMGHGCNCGWSAALAPTQEKTND